jgi:hypothetical protein
MINYYYIRLLHTTLCGNYFQWLAGRSLVFFGYWGFFPIKLIATTYTVRQKLSTTWIVSIISFLIMNLFQIGLLFSFPVHTYLLTCETGYWSIFIYVYMTGCVMCHVYFSTFVFANESWFVLCRAYMPTIERLKAVGDLGFATPPPPENCFSEGRKMVHSVAFWI